MAAITSNKIDASTFQLGELQYLTNAPDAYDYGWSSTLIYNAFIDDRGKVYRLCQNTDEFHARSQIARYDSGLYVTYRDNEPLTRAIEMGIIRPCENPVFIHRRMFDIDGYHSWPSEYRREVRHFFEELRDAMNIGSDSPHSEMTINAQRGGLEWHLVVRGDAEMFNKICGEFDAMMVRINKEA